MGDEPLWRSRLRWRWRGALLWPAFAVLTLVDALLLGVLPVWLVHRAARDSAETGGRSSAGTSAVGAFCAVSAGYLLVVLASAAYAQGGALPAEAQQTDPAAGLTGMMLPPGAGS